MAPETKSKRTPPSGGFFFSSLSQQTAPGPPGGSLVLAPSSSIESTPSEAIRLKFLVELASLLEPSHHSKIPCDITSRDSLQAHRCVVALRAPGIFTEDFFGKMKIFSLGSSHTTATVWRFLQWCYTGDYPEDLPLDSDWDDFDSAVRHSRVYFLAAALDVDDLKALAAAKYREWWTHRANWHCWNFCYTLKGVYENPDTKSPGDLLRKAALETAWRNHDDLKSEPFYLEIMCETKGFAADLAWEYLRKP